MLPVYTPFNSSYWILSREESPAISTRDHGLSILLIGFPMTLKTKPISLDEVKTFNSSYWILLDVGVVVDPALALVVSFNSSYWIRTNPQI